MKQPNTTFSHFLQLGRLMRSRMSKGISLPMPQIEALQFIAERPSPTMRELAEYLKVKAPSVTALITELVRAGLVARAQGKDRRSIALALTKKGMRRFEETMAARKRVVASVLSGLSAREQAQLNHLLEVIITHNR